MDWTFNPLVALFFAIENDESCDCCVYISHMYSGLVDVVSRERIWGDATISPIVPRRTHARYTNQESVLTVCANPSLADYEKVHKKILIPAAARLPMRWKLRRIGITKAFIYGNLDGLAYDVMRVTELSYKSYMKG